MPATSPSCAVALPRQCNNATSTETATDAATSKADATLKPTSLRELRVQLRAQLQRNYGQGSQDERPTELHRSERAGTDAYFAWRIHLKEGKSLRVTFSPEVTHAETLSLYPSALAVEPIREVREANPMSGGPEENR